MTRNMPANHQIIFCTCPDKDTAEKIARLLVADNKAACVNILPGITSVYSWEGRIESAQEHLLLIKAHKDRYQAIETALRDNHPYELPEIIAVPIERGLPEYLHWIDSCHSSK
ncbi:divalent cation tolerance protein [Methylobacter tundripaludum]|uniref:Divalent cation tolerance protein n=1 Tax=Methylobacter tundripaludum TaxID=173365 RepID=A0A2S6H5R9_9GAMM|nr:divalent-cation tolerance protein CutA [Methylobacter tundripaludum]PPK72822.1 divalent cation tolerance protein [Methylobacter tundripaludum]